MNEGYGLEAQEQNLKEHLQSNTTLGLKDAKLRIFSDTHTGSELNRPGLQKLLDEVKKEQFDVVVVWKIDRFSRSMKHLVHLTEILDAYGVSFVSVQENVDFRGAIGKLVFHLFSSIAEFERHLIKDRTLSGKIASAKMGNYTGGWAPYGYNKIKNPNCTKGSVLEVQPIQSLWIKKIFRWYVFEGLCFARVAQRLNEKGVSYKPQGRVSKHGTWTEHIIFTIIGNPIYRGMYVANKKASNGKELPPELWTVVETPPIVDSLLWHQAQKARVSRRKHHGKDCYLLSRKMVDCEVPGRRSFIGVKRTKGGISYRRKRFIDPNGTVHPNFEVPGARIENHTWELIENALSNPRRFYNTYLRGLEGKKGQMKAHEDAEEELRKRVAEIEEIEIPRIEHAYETGIYSGQTTQRRLMEKEEELQGLRKQLDAIRVEAETLDLIENEYECLERLSADYRQGLSMLTRIQKKALCDLLVQRIDLRREEVGQQRLVTGRIYLRFDQRKKTLETLRVRTREGLKQGSNNTITHKSWQSGDDAKEGYKKSSIDANLRGQFVIDFRL